MLDTRTVDKLLCIFDLPDSTVTGLSGAASARVMLLYDRKKNERRFTVLGRDLTLGMTGEIESWLEENIRVENMGDGLNFGDSHVKLGKGECDTIPRGMKPEGLRHAQ